MGKFSRTEYTFCYLSGYIETIVFRAKRCYKGSRIGILPILERLYSLKLLYDSCRKKSRSRTVDIAI